LDALLTGIHQVGDSHFELLRAFASDVVLASVSEAFRARDYRPHEFGDSLLIERQRRARHQALALAAVEGLNNI
jgi:S-adenosylmethionine:tRNA ribosyltransferase-isomerase